MNRTLWMTQTLLAGLFIFAGLVKLLSPIQPMVDQTGLPAGLLLFVGVVEVLGGIGVILPGLLRLWTVLIPLAAAGLVIIMIGATVVTVQGGTVLLASIPFATGLMAAFVAYGRWRLAPLGHR